MAELIDDLLGLARISRATPKRERVDLTAIARKVLGELSASDPERDVAAHVADGLVVEADARLMTCLLENLLGNAWKFSAKTARARIEFTAESLAGTDDGADVFVVRDNGAGFNMDYAKKLFQPFQRLHAASEFPGTGIGLATVLRIVRRHGGRIWAHAAPGQGARFYFTLREPA
jgi:signal transduction histidine kinase